MLSLDFSVFFSGVSVSEIVTVFLVTDIGWEG